jgi:hypothetical protein
VNEEKMKKPIKPNKKKPATATNPVKTLFPK